MLNRSLILNNCFWIELWTISNTCEAACAGIFFSIFLDRKYVTNWQKYINASMKDNTKSNSSFLSDEKLVDWPLLRMVFVNIFSVLKYRKIWIKIIFTNISLTIPHLVLKEDITTNLQMKLVRKMTK